MNLRTLRYLVTLADTGHFGQAAERCFVSQPTLSAQLKKLEQELGVLLIERRHKQATLTEVGEQIVRRAREILRQQEDIVAVAQGFQDPLAGRLSIGFIPTVGPYLLPHIVADLREACPRLQFFFGEYRTGELVRRLLAAELDLAVLALPHGQAHAEQLDERVLYEERFLVALPPGHKLRERRRVAASDLPGDELLLLEDGHCLRDQALAVCASRPSSAPRDMAATSLETLRQMVAAGQGLTLLPELAVDARVSDAAVCVRRLNAPEPRRTIGALWRRSTARHSAIDAVCTAIAASMREQQQRSAAPASAAAVQ